MKWNQVLFFVSNFSIPNSLFGGAIHGRIILIINPLSNTKVRYNFGNLMCVSFGPKFLSNRISFWSNFKARGFLSMFEMDWKIILLLAVIWMPFSGKITKVVQKWRYGYKERESRNLWRQYINLFTKKRVIVRRGILNCPKLRDVNYGRFPFTTA